MTCFMVQKIEQVNEVHFISCGAAQLHNTVTIHPVYAYHFHLTRAGKPPPPSWEQSTTNTHSKLTFSLRLVCMNSGNPRSWAPTSVSSLGGLKPTMPTPYSRQYLSSNSRFHLSICRYLFRFSNTITPYFPLSRFVSTGSDLPDTSTLYLVTHKHQYQLWDTGGYVSRDVTLHCFLLCPSNHLLHVYSPHLSLSFLHTCTCMCTHTHTHIFHPSII